jgi:hypothetical protein
MCLALKHVAGWLVLRASASELGSQTAFPERYLFDRGNGDGVVVWTGGRHDWSDEYCFNDFIDNAMTSEFGFCGSGHAKRLATQGVDGHVRGVHYTNCTSRLN